jgi:hypothetical protein
MVPVWGAGFCLYDTEVELIFVARAEAAGRERPVCRECGFVYYQNPVPAVGLLIEMEGGLVLIRRGHPPHADRWALPSGFAYDPAVDAIRNSAGVTLPNPEAYWATESIYIVPDDGGGETRVLIAAGVIPAGTLTLSILSDDAATVRAAHAVQVSGAWYDVVEVACEPAGGPGGWCDVQLRRRS